jgi:addiction module HigA family antidote
VVALAACVLDVIGEHFGRLEVIERVPNRADKDSIWACRCVCGAECLIAGSDLRFEGEQPCYCSRPWLHRHRPNRRRNPMARVALHPGEVLREEFMRPFGLTPDALAQALDVPAEQIAGIISTTKPRPLTRDMAARLAGYFGTTADFWSDLQLAHNASAAASTPG